MNYRLNDNIALRSWRLVPYAYYQKGQRNAKGLTREEFDFLSKCDGSEEATEDAALVENLLARGLISPCEKPEPLTSWQKPRVCDNRYFPAAIWSITGKCNFNCLHCFMAADNDRVQSYFTRSQWEKTLEELDLCGVQSITLTGGEPMVHPDFMDIMASIYASGMVVNEINTNGSFITAELLQALKDMGAFPLMKISFDCVGHHDWIRGFVGAEKQALDAIKLCISAGFSVKVQTNVHRLNIDALFDTAKLLAEMGVAEMRVIRTTEAPRWKENAGDACLDLLEYYDHMLNFTEQYAASGYQMAIDLWQFLSFMPRLRTYHYRPVEGGCHSFRASAPVCRGNRGMIAINSDGSLVPCLQLSGNFAYNGIKLGNVKETSLQKLLTESAYLDTVTCTIAKLHEENQTCRDCPYTKLCAGGCRAIAMALTGSYYGVDPAKCLYFQQGYMEKTDQVFARVAEKNGIHYHNVDDVR